MDALSAQDAAGDVHHLQGGIAAVVDYKVAVADVGEALGDVVGGFLGEDDFEAGGIVAIARVEGVARGLVQVDVDARGVVDEVQVVALNGLRVEGQRVGAVFLVDEVQRHHLGAIGVDFLVLINTNTLTGYCRTRPHCLDSRQTLPDILRKFAESGGWAPFQHYNQPLARAPSSL